MTFSDTGNNYVTSYGTKQTVLAASTPIFKIRLIFQHCGNALLPHVSCDETGILF